MDIFDKSLDAAVATLESLRPLAGPLGHAANLVMECVLGGRKLLVCGNGGSAADGADFATEFACRFSQDRRPYPALNLAACGSLLTATVNDYGAEQMFARPVRAFGRKGDILVALSTSGRSPSILRALETATSLDIITIALLGRDGGPARGMATIELIVPNEATARIQEAHKFLLHTLCEIVEVQLQAAEGRHG